MVSPRLFYCRQLNDEKDRQVDEIAEQLKSQFDGTDNSGHVFSEGDLCSVKLSDDHWYRGFILKVFSDESLSVWLADYGSKYQVDSSSIYPLPEPMRQLPAQCITTQMQFLTPCEEDGKYGKESCDRFRQLVVDRVMKITVLKTHQLIHRVIMTDKKTKNDVGDWMVKDGFAKYVFNKIPQYLLTPPTTTPSPTKAINQHQIIHHYSKPRGIGFCYFRKFCFYLASVKPVSHVLFLKNWFCVS